MGTLLFYHPAGQATLYRYGLLGEMTLLKTYSGWRSDWQQIIPVAFGRSFTRGLLFYDGAGTGEFYQTYGQGEMTLLRTYTGWQSDGRPWTHIIGLGHLPGTSNYGLLFYDGAGRGKLYTYDGQGDIALVRTYTDWRSSWKQIIPVWLDNATPALLFYDGLRTGEFYRYDGQGELALVSAYTDWCGGCQIVSM